MICEPVWVSWRCVLVGMRRPRGMYVVRYTASDGSPDPFMVTALLTKCSLFPTTRASALLILLVIINKLH